MKFTDELLFDIKQNDIISKDELLVILNKHFSSISRAYAYRIISELIKEHHLYKLDSSTYVTNQKTLFDYELIYKKIIKDVNGYGDYVIWDSNILNKWINHLLNVVITFVEVDADLMNLVFEALKTKGYNHILLNPNLNEFNKYINNQLIVIRPLTKAFIEPNHKISVERLIIQIYSDKLLSSLYGDVEMNNILNEIFKTYNVNLDKLYHYARRKKIYDRFHGYLVKNIDRKYLYHD